MSEKEIKEIKIYKANKSIIFINNGIAFSQFGVADEILDLIINLQEQLHQASLDIQELTEKDIGCPSWCDKLTNLQEENINCNKEYTKLIYKYNKLLEENERLRSKIRQINDLKETWQDVKENVTLVFDNNNLINFMNKLQNILKGDNND